MNRSIHVLGCRAWIRQAHACTVPRVVLGGRRSRALNRRGRGMPPREAIARCELSMETVKAARSAFAAGDWPALNVTLRRRKPGDRPTSRRARWHDHLSASVQPAARLGGERRRLLRKAYTRDGTCVSSASGCSTRRATAQPPTCGRSSKPPQLSRTHRCGFTAQFGPAAGVRSCRRNRKKQSRRFFSDPSVGVGARKIKAVVKMHHTMAAGPCARA